MTSRRFYRASKKNSLIAGVCAGIAEYLDVDPTIIRLIWTVGSFLWGLGIVAYLIGWIIIPRR